MDASRLLEARQALQQLLEDPIIGALPLLVLANKIDLMPPAERAYEEVRGWATLAEALNLDTWGTQRWSILGVSASRLINLDKVVRWLILQAHGVGLPGDSERDSSKPRHSSLWGSVFGWRSGPSSKRSGWWWSGGGRYTTILADASRSLIGAEG